MSNTKFQKGKGYVPTFYIPHPSSEINDMLWDGRGIPSGTIMQIQSDGEGSFKTTIAIQLAAQAQKQGIQVAYVDVENAAYWEDTHEVDDNGEIIQRCEWFENLGLDSSQIYYVPADSQEGIYDAIKSLIVNYGVQFIILDSIPAMEPASVQEKDAGENTVGIRAKINTTELVKLLNIYRKHNVVLCGINHKKEVITNQGSMGKRAVGGRGWGFYTQLIFVHKRSTAKSKLEDSDYIDLAIYVEKNKLGSSFRAKTVKIRQGYGLSEADKYFSLATKQRLLTKSGAWYKWKGESVAQGAQNIMRWIEDNIENIKEEINV